MTRRIILALALAMASVCSATLAKRIADEAVVLQPDAHLEEASKWATTFLTRAHYKKTRLNDALSTQILDRYLDSLDPNRIFFLANDILGFDAYRNTIDDALKKQDLSPAFVIFNVYTHRVDQRIELALQLIQKGFDFTVDETLELDRSQDAWASTEEELAELWRKRVKNDVLRLMLADKAQENITKTLTDRYQNLGRRIHELDSEDVFQYFMNAFATSIEPHTGYLAPRTSENFQISMQLSLEGIGAVLQRENEYTVVRRVVPGGPAHRDGRLQVGDRILAVGQEAGLEAIDVIGWRLDDVVDLIRGKMGTSVRLDIVPADATVDGKVEQVELIRDKVKLEEQAAQKELYEYTLDGESKRIGVIDLPAFYLDFAARARREPDYRSSTRDVRQLLRELKQTGADGVIIDLRNNGGGSLAEATELTGLFIDSGPVVQVRESDGKVQVETDVETGIEWDGPLAVLVNRHSASASEIFAAAIQDYGRGVIVGEPTFGKGTVQNLINLDRYGGGDDPRYGQLKLTIAQFFRVNGGSTQHRGVLPDIAFPTMEAGEKHGESSLDNALPWTSIQPARYEIHDDLSGILPAIEMRSKDRVKNNVEFRYLLEDIRSLHAAQKLTTVSLLEEVRRSELLAEEQLRKTRKAAREAWASEGSNDYPVVLLEPRRAVERPPSEIVSDDDDTQSEEVDEKRSDVLLDEAVRIVGDMILLTRPERRTAQVIPKPDELK